MTAFFHRKMLHFTKPGTIKITVLSRELNSNCSIYFILLLESIIIFVETAQIKIKNYVQKISFAHNMLQNKTKQNNIYYTKYKKVTVKFGKN